MVLRNFCTCIKLCMLLSRMQRSFQCLMNYILDIILFLYVQVKPIYLKLFFQEVQCHIS